jgi:hypothetical protein
MAEKKKKAAPKKKAEPKGTYKIRQSYPNTVGLEPQLLPLEFSTKKDAESYAKRKECCEVIKVD